MLRFAAAAALLSLSSVACAEEPPLGPEGPVLPGPLHRLALLDERVQIAKCRPNRLMANADLGRDVSKRPPLAHK